MSDDSTRGSVKPGALVCVTGANGFIGSYVVRDLLAAGYRVRGTVRDPSDARKTAHLRGLAEEVGAAERLELARGDLLSEGSFDEAMVGAEGVVHCAAAVFFNAADPQRDIVDPSVKGTRNALEAVARAGGVRRVVHTSSLAAIYGWDKPPGHVFTEADWNTSSTLSSDPYGLAKVQAEKAALAFVEGLSPERRFDLVHLNPGMVFGPPLVKAHAKASPSLVRDVLSRANPGVPNLSLSVVDVRDVAQAHVLALQADAPPPRCLLTAHDGWMPEHMGRLQALFPDIKMGASKLPKPLVLLAALTNKALNPRQLWHLINTDIRADNALSRSAYGLTYRPLDETLRDTAEPMLAHGWARVQRR